jgi:hypothetical protein
MALRAAIGGTRVERSAGSSAASRVTITPTRIETITVRASSTSEVVGRSIPSASNRALSPRATAKPPAIPISAPTSPIATASTSTVVRICRREAPSVRSIPNSLTRWATVIEKVLKIRNEPTTTAMKPKTSRKVRRKPSPSSIFSVERSAFSFAVSTLMPGGISAAIRRLSAVAETPGAAATEIWSKRPALRVSACAVGSVTWAIEVPPKEALPSWVKPTSWNCRNLPWPTSPIFSPSSSPELSAAPLSIEASVGPRGRWPST